MSRISAFRLAWKSGKDLYLVLRSLPPDAKGKFKIGTEVDFG